MTLTATDLFAGIGGSTTGLEETPGIKVIYAANHWPLAVEAHNANHPNTDHDCADISQVNPARVPRTDILWASPECTNHSQAKGKTRKGRLQPSTTDSDGKELPSDAEERSRATMWDVVRFTEHHRYKIVIVENVVEAAFWAPFQAWLMAMLSLGYEHQIVFLNSAHAQAAGTPAAQSRDRIYIVFHRKGDRRPDIAKWTSPMGTCQVCGHRGQLQRSWKKRSAAWPLEQWGRYGAKHGQYVFRCDACLTITEPDILPAYSIIDWSIPAERIGDRPLREFFDRTTEQSLGFHRIAPKTHARVAAGIRKHRGELLAVPLEGREGVQAKPLSELLRCQTTRAQTGLVIPGPFVVEMRGGGSSTRSVINAPLATVTAGGNHHYLTVPPALIGGFVMRNNGSTGDGGEHCTSLGDLPRTFTTKGHQSLVTWEPDAEPSVEDCGLRMFTPQEIRAATALPANYILLGTKREQVAMLGNAVTPPAARDLGCAVVEALEGTVQLNHRLAA